MTNCILDYALESSYKTITYFFGRRVAVGNFFLLAHNGHVADNFKRVGITGKYHKPTSSQPSQ